MNKKAVVLLSGGIDSSVCLAIAKSQGFDCYALSVDYNQRNRFELTCAKKIAIQIGVKEHRVIGCDFNVWGGSALTDFSQKVDSYTCSQVNTYVPARNTILLSLALGWGEALGALDIFFAANADDYNNYPDCRPEYFTSFSQIAGFATRSGTDGKVWQIHTPLLHFSKLEIVQKGVELNVDLSQTFSCYDPVSEIQACLKCLACHLRTEAFAMAAYA